MKKILSALLCAMMVVSMVACDSAPSITPEELYNQVMNDSMGIKTADVSSNIVMNMSAPSQGLEMDMTMDMDVLMDMTDEENIKFYSSAKTNTMGMELDIISFYADGYQYMEMMGQKMKQEMPLETFLATAQTNPQVILAEDMETFEMTEADGNKTFTFTVKADRMQALFEEAMGSMGDMAAMAGAGEFSFEDMSGNLVIDADNNIVSQNISMIVSVTVEGETMDMDMDMNMVYNSYNEPVEITIPATDDYTEIPA